jgi:predicted permease
MWRSLRIRLAGLLRRDRLEQDMADELQFHLEQRTNALARAGVSRTEAERRARVEFGAVEAYKDRCRDERGWRLGDELRSDGRYAWRMLRKNPGFAFVAIATLAIGIGANAAIFSIVNGVLLRPLPFPDPERLTKIYEATSVFDGVSTVAYPDYLDWRDSARSFAQMAAYVPFDASITIDGEAEHVRALWGSAELLSLLGASPVLGRGIVPEEDKLHGTPVALISYSLWQTHYGGRGDVIGRRITVESDMFTIVGILPAGFSFGRPFDILLPLGRRNSPVMQGREFHAGIQVIGRLKPGVRPGQAHAEMTAIATALADRYPKTNKGWTAVVRPLLDDVVGNVRPTLWLLLGAVSLVLLIACANVANLLLTRAEGRRRELAMRAALGAGYPRLIRQLVLESVLLSLIGGVGGLVLAGVVTRVLLRQLPITIPRAADVGVDWRVVAFTFVGSLLTGILFGLAPALHSARVDVQEVLKAVSRGVIGRQGSLRGLFVVIQLALGLVLLVSTGLLLRTLWQISQVDPGFDLHHLVTMRIGLPGLGNGEPARIRQWFRDAEERISRRPGVDSAAFTTLLPLSGDDNEVQYWTGPPPADPSRAPAALLYVSTPRHFETLKIPLHAGRTFTWDDGKRSPLPIVIDDVLAQRAFGGQHPVGQTLTLQILGKAEVIGVAGHSKHWGLDTADDAAKVREQMYLPFSHVPDPFANSLATAGPVLLIRSSLEPAQLMQAVKTELRGNGATQPVYALHTMEDVAAVGTVRRRFLAIVLGLFASIAIVLAGIGVYGVMAYSVSQRVQEIGIRMALGASARQILDQVLGQGVRLVVVGVGAGLVAGALATRLLSSLLFGVSATDPLTFAAVALLLVGVALLACAVPALRAVRIEPTTALRQE